MPNNILLIIIDACRPDALAQVHTPHLDALWQAGAGTLKARSVVPSVSLCAHTSMFRGITPEKHGIGADNIFNPQAAAYPSFLDILHQGGKQAAMFYSWEELRDLAAPGSLALSHYQRAVYGEDNDTPLMHHAAAQICLHQPDFACVYLGDVDITGHGYGWMSAEYLQAIERSDQAIGHLLATLEAAQLRERYTLLVLADHGGHDFNHGSDSPEDMTIPWLLSGPGIKVNHSLQTPVMLYDTAPTIVQFMGLTSPTVWDGQAITEAFA